MSKTAATRGGAKPAPKPQVAKQIVLRLPRNYIAVEGGYIIKGHR